MRSSIPILAALVSLAVATPITGYTAKPADPCACDYLCIAQAGPDCACEIAAKLSCHSTQRAAGLSCPLLTISPSCANSTNSPTPGPTSHPKPKPHFALEGDRCGTKRSKKCAPDLKCDKRHLKCFDCPGVCRPKLPPQPVFAAEGESCGSRGMKRCASGLFCFQRSNKCADCPGKCMAMPFGPINSTVIPEPVLGKTGDKCGSKGLKTCADDLYCGGQKQGCMDCPGTCMAKPLLPTAVPLPQPIPTAFPTAVTLPQPIYTATTAGTLPQPSHTTTPYPTSEGVFGKVGEKCGSKGLKNCGEELVCGQQKEGCMDCGGVCEKKVIEKTCGGFMGVECDGEMKCVLDEICLKEGGSDCQGTCKGV